MISYSFNLSAAIQAPAWACGRCYALWQVKWKPREISSSYKRSEAFSQSKKYFFPSSFWGTDRWKEKKVSCYLKTICGFPLSTVNQCFFCEAEAVHFAYIYSLSIVWVAFLVKKRTTTRIEFYLIGVFTNVVIVVFKITISNAILFESLTLKNQYNYWCGYCQSTIFFMCCKLYRLNVPIFSLNLFTSCFSMLSWQCQ